ncbi:MAG TPA: porin family protein [Burkholderiales bacterium]|nr:porin family protein [Burkholderiales bacterium]
MKSAAVILALATTAVALPAAAQLNMSSVYVGGGLGRANYKAPSETDTAWRVFGGYQINRNFAAEIGYHNLGEVNFVQGQRNAKVWELVGIGAFPVATNLSVYGKLGAYYAKSELQSAVVPSGDDTQGGLTYGFGAQYDFTQQMGVRAEWQRYDQVGGARTGETDIDVMNVSLLYRFR